MRKVGLMWKKGVSVLLALSLFLLLTSSLIGCGGGGGGSDSGGGGSDGVSFTAAQQDAFKTAVDAYFDGYGGVTSSALDITADKAAGIDVPSRKSGISVAVYKDGINVWTYAKGIKSSSLTIFPPVTTTPMTTTTPSYAYSITKTMVSALVLSQIQAGRYTLNNTVAELLGDHADYGAIAAAGSGLYINTDATVEQLLTHTSGMPDYASNVSGLMTLGAAGSWKPADILTGVVNANHGAAGSYAYSNTNYVLLGMIAQWESSKHGGSAALNTLLASNFFTPLSLSVDLSPQDAYPSDIAHPFDETVIFGAGDYGFQDLETAASALYPTLNLYTTIGRGTWAAGGIISTAANIAKWGYELYDVDGTAIATDVRTTLLASAPTDGDYGYGVVYNDFTYNDLTAGGQYGHGGGGPGYRTLLVYETNQRLAVAILTNAMSSTVGDSVLVDRVALADALFNCYKDGVFTEPADPAAKQAAAVGSKAKVFGK
jgi:D-alanyl-D-alanine carboxypeptidase